MQHEDTEGFQRNMPWPFCHTVMGTVNKLALLLGGFLSGMRATLHTLGRLLVYHRDSRDKGNPVQFRISKLI